MSRIRSLVLCLTTAFLVVAGPGTSPADDEAPPSDSPRVEKTRTGSTPRGARRLVIETDKKIDYLVTELEDTNGFDVQLIGAAPGNAPTEMKIDDDRVERVVFRLEETGLVARILGAADRPLTTKSFRLDDPPRVVVDVYPRANAGSDAPRTAGVSATSKSNARPATPAAAPPAAIDLASGEPLERTPVPVTEPKLVRKPFRTVQPEQTGPVEVAAGERKGPPTGTEKTDDPEVAAADTAAVEPGASTLFETAAMETTVSEKGETPPAPTDFENLVGWIHALKTRVDGLRVAEDEAMRASIRRDLAFLLMERGIFAEAEKALMASLESEDHDPSTAFADSLTLAEIRLKLGRIDGASEIARNVDAGDRSPSDHVRLAAILLECGLTAPAIVLLEPAVPRLAEPERGRARLLLARARWDQGQSDVALRIVHKLTTSSHTPSDVLASALILEADCLWAKGEYENAETHYRRAAGLALSAEEASWTGLQLGNLARRAGREEEAREHYRATHEKWPDTFYGAQADWFLRIGDRIQRMYDRERIDRRG
jgi:tetratricopeptide (TPR) repeat protein